MNNNEKIIFGNKEIYQAAFNLAGLAYLDIEIQQLKSQLENEDENCDTSTLELNYSDDGTFKCLSKVERDLKCLFVIIRGSITPETNQGVPPTWMTDLKTQTSKFPVAIKDETAPKDENGNLIGPLPSPKNTIFNVNTNFLDFYNLGQEIVYKIIKKYYKNVDKIILVGHSIGGAFVELCYTRYRPIFDYKNKVSLSCISIGAPKVADDDFREYFRNLIETTDDVITKYGRFVNEGPKNRLDAVVGIPDGNILGGSQEEESQPQDIGANARISLTHPLDKQILNFEENIIQNDGDLLKLSENEVFHDIVNLHSMAAYNKHFLFCLERLNKMQN